MDGLINPSIDRIWFLLLVGCKWGHRTSRRGRTCWGPSELNGFEVRRPKISHNTVTTNVFAPGASWCSWSSRPSRATGQLGRSTWPIWCLLCDEIQVYHVSIYVVFFLCLFVIYFILGFTRYRRASWSCWRERRQGHILQFHVLWYVCIGVAIRHTAGVTDIFVTKSCFLDNDSCEGLPVWSTLLDYQITQKEVVKTYYIILHHFTVLMIKQLKY